MSNRDEIDMFELLARAMGGESTDTIIRDQEKRGQMDLVNSETLPRFLSYKKESAPMLQKMGIVVLEPIDDLFYAVQLPSGWKKVPTNHSMWSDLIDEKGRKRAAIFYKAAFYDRRAEIGITRRYNFHVQPVGGYRDDWNYEKDPRECVVTDNDTVIWKSDPITPTEILPSYKISEKLEPLGLAWLNEHYPEWQDEFAYWD